MSRLWITLPIAILLSYFVGVALSDAYGEAGLLISFPVALALGWVASDLADY